MTVSLAIFIFMKKKNEKYASMIQGHTTPVLNGKKCPPYLLRRNGIDRDSERYDRFLLAYFME